jgi:hypothetical protein
MSLPINAAGGPAASGCLFAGAYREPVDEILEQNRSMGPCLKSITPKPASET